MTDEPGGRVVVVGAGAAGTAAAVSAARAGAHVTLVDGGSGASTLASGALDFVPWQSDVDGHGGLDPDARAVLDTLDAYALPPTPAPLLIATTAGLLRPACGADRAVLDLAGFARGPVLVPRSDHHAWDAVTLARSWSDSAQARARGLSFMAIDAQITRFRDERPLRDPEIAARHDDPARLAWLADRLKEALARGGPFSGVVLPPWLGVERARAEELSARVGVPCGEAVSGLASAAGLRFERARDRATAAALVEVARERVTTIATSDAGWTIAFESGATWTTDAVVLATGGLVGGGVAYEPSASIFATAVPPYARPTFRCVIDAPVTVGARGRPLELPGSLFGAPPESVAWPFGDDALADRVGLLTSADLRATGAPAGLYACGELVADLPRAWLASFVSGVRAGAAAAMHARSGATQHAAAQ